MSRRYITMNRGLAIVTAVVATASTACGGRAAAPTPGASATQIVSPSAPSATASLSATATPQATPSADVTPGWRTYTDQASAYSLQYPESWFLIANPSFSSGTAFSNENAGYFPRTSPEVGTPANVFLQVGSYTTGCGGAHDWVTSSSDITLGGEQARRYVVAMPPAYGNPDPLDRIVVEGTHKGQCWFLTFDSRTKSARDSNAALDDQIVASFKFLD